MLPVLPQERERATESASVVGSRGQKPRAAADAGELLDDAPRLSSMSAMLYSVHHKAPSRRELEVRSLGELCLDSLAAHFELIEDLGPHVSSAQYAALLAHGNCRATPEAVARVEALQPQLASQASDEAFWAKRPEVVSAWARGVGPVCRVAALVTDVDAPLEAAVAAGAVTVEGGVACVAAVAKLAKLPVSLQVLERTRVGITLSRAIKLEGADGTHAGAAGKHFAFRDAAATLLKTWKARAAAAGAAERQGVSKKRREAATSTPPRGAEDDDFVAARAGACETWQDVHGLLVELAARKRERFCEKARRLYSEEKASKKLTKVIQPGDRLPKRRRVRSPEPAPDFRVASNVSRPPSFVAARASQPPMRASRVVAQPPPPRPATAVPYSRAPRPSGTAPRPHRGR